MNTVQSSACRRAFTLVELLVVISIIAILAAMLVPSLQKSVNTAKIVHCRANLKSIYLACIMYADDNYGLIPWGGKDTQWCGVGDLMLKKSGSEMIWMHLGLLVGSNYTDTSIFRCIADKKKFSAIGNGVNGILKKHWKEEKWQGSYYNMCQLQWPLHTLGAKSNGTWPDRKLKTSNRKGAFVIDGVGGDKSFTRQENHPNGVNVLYPRGNIGFIPREIYYDNPYSWKWNLFNDVYD